MFEVPGKEGLWRVATDEEKQAWVKGELNASICLLVAGKGLVLPAH